MKTPYYAGSLLAAQHKDFQTDELRERMLEYRLANRDDAREIYVVTTPPTEMLSGPRGATLVEQASKKSRSDLSWAMHWAIQVGDQYFELQRGHYDPTRTGLRMSKWNQHQKSQIVRRYRQGITAMSDDEIKATGDTHFRRLNRMHINKYDLWCNNCQVAVDNMLRDIGGLYYYRSKLESLNEWIKQFFCNSILQITRMYYRHRGCDEEVIIRHEKVLNNTLDVITSRSMHYPKRQWIKEDISEAEGVMKKMGTIRDHFFLTILESSLSLRKGSENSYVRRGADGKPELNFDAVTEAVKGIFDEDENNNRAAWLKAIPWLTAGFLVGTPRWAFAVMSIAIQQVSHFSENNTGLMGGLEQNLGSLGVSPKLQDSQFITNNTPRPRSLRKPPLAGRNLKKKSQSIDSRLVARYERCLTHTGVPYYFDHKEGTRTWEAPDQQEMCLRIIDPPLSRKWEEKEEGDRIVYFNRVTEETVDKRPGAAEIWAIKKKTTPDWVKSTIMALPPGWELRRTDDGEKYYVNHNDDPCTSTTYHPMRREIEDERQRLLPEWNVEWDEDRGKKYRNLQNGTIRWKAIDGPLYVPANDKAKTTGRKPKHDFIEPLPPGWTFSIDLDGQKRYINAQNGIERFSHPLCDKRRKLLPDWEMRYTPGNLRYWVHYGRDGRGTTWWTRNRLLKNTTLKNNASGWKLTSNQEAWEWFEGGDVAHKDIPVLDLDDPAEIEFREYPFILPAQITNNDGDFLEPLPSDWVRRLNADDSLHYWNFRNETRSDQHPNEDDRKELHALWEMRYTRHGRQYFLHHFDGSTWWTHPREAKHKQVLRASIGHSQDGWKLAENGKGWERFEEHPNVSIEQQNMLLQSPTQSTEEESVKDAEEAENWKSLAFTKDWLKTISSNEMVVNAMTQFQDHTKALSESKQIPKIGHWLAKTKRDTIEPEPIDTVERSEDVPSETRVTEEAPQSIKTRKSWGRKTSDLLKLNKKKSKRDDSADDILDNEDILYDSPVSSKEGLGLTVAESVESGTLHQPPTEATHEDPGSQKPLIEGRKGSINEENTIVSSPKEL